MNRIRSVHSPLPRDVSGGSTTSPRPSQPSSPGPKFDSELLKPYMKVLISKTLQGNVWDGKDRERTRRWCKEIGDRVKERMIEIQPRGFKYIVTTFVNENLGQGGRADMACHWEDSDTVAQEMFSNDSIICICIAFAIRAS